MNVRLLIEYMVSMMNAKKDILSSYGKYFLSALIVFQSPHYLMIEYYVCMVDLVWN